MIPDSNYQTLRYIERQHFTRLLVIRRIDSVVFLGRWAAPKGEWVDLVESLPAQARRPRQPLEYRGETLFGALRPSHTSDEMPDRLRRFRLRSM